MVHGKARVLPVDEGGGQMGVDELITIRRKYSYLQSGLVHWIRAMPWE
jgi:hypothetical protein